MNKENPKLSIDFDFKEIPGQRFKTTSIFILVLFKCLEGNCLNEIKQMRSRLRRKRKTTCRDTGFYQVHNLNEIKFYFHYCTTKRNTVSLFYNGNLIFAKSNLWVRVRYRYFG